MKKLYIMIIGLLFTASAVFASPTTKVEFATMSKTDTQVLFGNDSTDVVALSSNEMITTKGEFVPFVYWAYTGFRGWRAISTAWRWGPYGFVGGGFSGWR